MFIYFGLTFRIANCNIRFTELLLNLNLLH